MGKELEKEQLRAMLPLLRVTAKAALDRSQEMLGAALALIDESLEAFELAEAGDEAAEERLAKLCVELNEEHTETLKIGASINAAYPAFAERAANPEDAEPAVDHTPTLKFQGGRPCSPSPAVDGYGQDETGAEYAEEGSR